MKTKEFKITIHMVSSLDGFIAKKDNSISWFETTDNYEKGVCEQNTEEFLNSIDCYLMGSKTYEHALELSKSYGWAYGDKPTIVLTNRQLTSNKPNIEFYSGNLKSLINNRLKPNYKNVWVAGGAEFTKSLIQQKLADEIRVSILPIILGEGLLFFDNIAQELNLHLIDSIAYKNGMIELHYKIKKE